MAGQLYRVVFEGEILEGSQVQEVKRALAKMYKTGEDQIERFFSGKRLAVKKSVNYQTAMKYVKAFERAGAVCRIEELETHTGSEQPLMLEKETEEPAQQEDLMVCPRCQFEQAFSEECIRCGIVVSKFYESPQIPGGEIDSGRPEADLAAFIGDNARKYISKFKRFERGGVDHFALTWNWAAFFFGSLWLLYRKLYKWAILAFIMEIIPLVNVVAQFGFALTGNYLYYKHTTGKIKELKRSRQSSLDLKASLADAGGVHRRVVGVAVVVCILLAVAGAYVESLEYGGKRRVGKISFFTDYDEGLDQAFESGKPVMLVFSASWCGACKKMKRDVFSNDDVAVASEQLVNIYIDVDDKADRDLVRHYEIRYVPSVFFLDYSGQTVMQVADRRSPKDFIENMDYMAQEYGKN